MLKLKKNILKNYQKVKNINETMKLGIHIFLVLGCQLHGVEAIPQW